MGSSRQLPSAGQNNLDASSKVSSMRGFFLLPLLSVFLLFSSSLYGADVSGRVSFSGSAPEPQKIDMKTDSTCLKLHAKPVFNEEILVNTNGTLRNVFVYVKEGLEGQSFEIPAQPVELVQEGCLYSPRVFGVQAGQPIQMTNKDATLHNVRAKAKEQKEFNLGMPMQGMKLKKQFSKTEVMVPFKCDVHPWMKAYAGVLPHPFYAVTDDAGTFRFTGLPAGEYTLEAWHEKLGTQTLKLSVEEGSEPSSVDFQFTAA